MAVYKSVSDPWKTGLFLALLLLGGLPISVFSEPAPPPQDPFSSPTEKRSLPDPVEPFNRAMFQVNDRLYRFGLRPVTHAYVDVTPAPVRNSITRFFANLREPRNAMNSLLQARFMEAGGSLTRLIVNTTLGLGGLYDPAGYWVERTPRSFNQTLHSWGVPAGNYFVWPLFGASSLRSTGASAVDWLLHPYPYLEGEDRFQAVVSLYSLDTIDQTAPRLGDYRKLKLFSVDPYLTRKRVYESKMPDPDP